MVLTICVLAKSEICVATSGCLSSVLNHEELKKEFGLVRISYCIGQSDLPKARSEQLSAWYENAKNEDIFMFIDNDQTFLPDDLLKCSFYLKNYPLVCGVYARANGGITSEPDNKLDFYRNREGELLYGATGFMMMTYNCVDTLAKKLDKAMTNSQFTAYPFFLERIVSDKNMHNIWLSEDYSFTWLVRQHVGTVWGFISPTIGHIITSQKFVDVPTIQEWPENSVVIFCGLTPESWSAKNLKKGIGGSELAVIELARRWADSGYSVTVYCNCNSVGIHDKVVYKSYKEFNLIDKFNVLILWRNIECIKFADLNARKVIIDFHDILYEDIIDEATIKKIDKICVKSNYQASMLGSHIPREKIAVIPNGGAYENLEFKVEKDRNYLIYSSSYDRGLAFMLKWGWPRIKQACPNAYLKIYYGWESFDLARGKSAENTIYKKVINELMEQDGVEHCGRVSREKLLKEKAKAAIHYYVGDFQEIDCISVRESACLGAIPVVSREAKVFQEKPYCITIPGDAKLRKTQEDAADLIISLLKDDNLYRDTCNTLKVPKDETWDATAKKWTVFF